MRDLPHTYYEENNLHAFLIENQKNYEEVLKELELFLPYVDNWATCDMMRPKVFKNELCKLIEMIPHWISSNETYTIRFGIGMLMSYYLGEAFQEEYHAYVYQIESDEYYVNMMIAWYFATALAKQYASTIKHFESPKLAKWTHNKAIQKAIESSRITIQQKEYLRSLKL